MAPRWRLIAGASAVYVLAVGVGYTYAGAARTPGELASEPRRRQAYDTLALSGKYEDQVAADERVLGMRRIRARLLHYLGPGDRVLEVAAGPATNSALYHPDTPVTMVDNSEAMLERARAVTRSAAGQRLLLMDAERLDFPDNSFDAVVDTFGLCSFEDPRRALSEMHRVCRPGGRLLLLEHGRSTYRFVNWYLDRRASSHSHKWGCIWNRDVMDIFRSASLNLLASERFHMGTTVLIVAQKPDT